MGKILGSLYFFLRNELHILKKITITTFNILILI